MRGHERQWKEKISSTPSGSILTLDTILSTAATLSHSREGGFLKLFHLLLYDLINNDQSHIYAFTS